MHPRTSSGEKEGVMDTETKPGTPETVDPVQFTRERLKEVQKVWLDFAKTKVGPYVEKSQKWVRQYKPTPKTDGSTPA